MLHYKNVFFEISKQCLISFVFHFILRFSSIPKLVIWFCLFWDEFRSPLVIQGLVNISRFVLQGPEKIAKNSLWAVFKSFDAKLLFWIWYIESNNSLDLGWTVLEVRNILNYLKFQSLSDLPRHILTFVFWETRPRMCDSKLEAGCSGSHRNYS